jgi:hypothetical protein
MRLKERINLALFKAPSFAQRIARSARKTNFEKQNQAATWQSVIRYDAAIAHYFPSRNALRRAHSKRDLERHNQAATRQSVIRYDAAVFYQVAPLKYCLYTDHLRLVQQTATSRDRERFHRKRLERSSQCGYAFFEPRRGGIHQPRALALGWTHPQGNRAARESVCPTPHHVIMLLFEEF